MLRILAAFAVFACAAGLDVRAAQTDAAHAVPADPAHAAADAARAAPADAVRGSPRGAC